MIQNFIDSIKKFIKKQKILVIIGILLITIPFFYSKIDKRLKNTNKQIELLDKSKIDSSTIELLNDKIEENNNKINNMNEQILILTKKIEILSNIQKQQSKEIQQLKQN